MRSSRSAPDWLTARPYAHRGLHAPGRLENSRAAFEAAIAAGFGIELDVQLSRDGEAMVFHDYALDRLTGEPGKLIERSAAELQRVQLLGMDETIPILPEILRLIGGRCGLLIELKAPKNRVSALSGAVERALRDYPGEAAIMSFNPAVGRWFARHAPDVTRGLVVTEEGKGGVRGRLERAFGLAYSGAQFLAYDIRDLPSPFAAAVRRTNRPVLTWTVRVERDEQVAALHADQIIHELPQDNG